MVKKYITFILVALVLCGCTHASKMLSQHIVLSKTSTVQVFNMKHNIQQSSYIPDDKLLFELAILDDLKTEKNHFKGESYNETPTNITTYYSIVIMTDNRQYKIHIYEQNKKYYAEIPYNGIWEISDRIYQKMTKLFD